ncbi:hypothetical protein BT93_C2265 [Corymbia citriodora subsp. variegata]|nr:hypothetical protein BT93_C2265 [Corymbia citriodora subsp. variegata]
MLQVLQLSIGDYTHVVVERSNSRRASRNCRIPRLCCCRHRQIRRSLSPSLAKSSSQKVAFGHFFAAYFPHSSAPRPTQPAGHLQAIRWTQTRLKDRKKNELLDDKKW